MSLSRHRFLLVGDWGNSSTRTFARVVHDIGHLPFLHARDAPVDILSAGDNLYPVGAHSWLDPMWHAHYQQAWANVPADRLLSVLGNHDKMRGTPVGLFSSPENASSISSVASPPWVMPNAYWVQHFPDIRTDIWFLDTCELDWQQSIRLGVPTPSDIVNRAAVQLAWLRDTLSQSRAAFKMCVGHYPVVSRGPHGGSAQLQQHLLPLFREFKVDLYISGHDHNLQWGRDPEGSTHFLISGAASYHVPPAYKSPHRNDLLHPDWITWTGQGGGYWDVEVVGTFDTVVLVATCHHATDEEHGFEENRFFLLR
ncbi:hypothetical protein EBZ80_14700 [bacterium]|nr:hypothetical protein [bacterium]